MFSIAADIRNTLGECPLWCERTRRLYWTDIEASELLALEEGNDAVIRWSLPERLGSFALTVRSHILLRGSLVVPVMTVMDAGKPLIRLLQNSRAFRFWLIANAAAGGGMKEFHQLRLTPRCVR